MQSVYKHFKHLFFNFCNLPVVDFSSLPKSSSPGKNNRI